MSIIKSAKLAMIGLAWSATAMAQEYVPGEVIVKFKDKQQGKAAFSSKAVGLSMNLKRSWTGMNLHQFKAKASNQNVQQLISEMRADPNVEYVEPNYILKKQSTGIEGSRMSKSELRGGFSSQVMNRASSTMGAMATSTYYQSDANIQVEQAWSVLSSTSPVTPVVAVIDTGCDYNHEVFASSNAIWRNTDEIANNGIDDDQNGYIDDVRGWNFVGNNNNPMDDEDHGTHVSGIIFGVSQDIFAGTLTQAKIKIMPLKFLDNSGNGATSDAIEAIYYAINNGASVINASWGGGSYSQALEDAIVAAYSAKVTFVAAAGNSRQNNDATPTYPANYVIPNLISIAATNDVDALASFSNYGRSTVQIASPGVSILSTLPNDSYAYSSGTSMAAPLVAGIVALMEREAGHEINGYQAGQVLFNQNDKNVGNITNKVVTNARVNVFKAVNYAKNNAIEDTQPAYTPSAMRLLASAGDSGGGGCGMVSQIASGGSTGSSAGDLFGRGLLMLIVLSPFAVALIMKQRRKEQEDRRAYQRYNITSEVRIALGDKELVGSVSSISLGGVKINTEALLENGGIVEMNIMSPDGKERVQVLGKVVWSQERKSYGVQFCDMAETQTSSISGWTKHLVKSS